MLRRLGPTTMVADAGSTEVPFPTTSSSRSPCARGRWWGSPPAWAIAQDDWPALVVLLTTAGLGNAVGALATARVNRAPLVVVGQQDRRHLALEPFLAGLAGDYPVSVDQPVRPQDVHGAVARAHGSAATRRCWRCWTTCCPGSGSSTAPCRWTVDVAPEADVNP